MPDLPDTNLQDVRTSAILFYDADCSICRHLAGMVRRRAQSDRLQLIPLQQDSLSQQFPYLDSRQLQGDLHVLLPDCRVRQGADAVYEVLRCLPGWRWWAWLYRVPGIHALSYHGYRYLSLNRHRLGLHFQDMDQKESE